MCATPRSRGQSKPVGEKDFVVRLRGRGQITLPSKVCFKLDLVGGEELKVIMPSGREDIIVLQRQQSSRSHTSSLSLAEILASPPVANTKGSGKEKAGVMKRKPG